MLQSAELAQSAYTVTIEKSFFITVSCAISSYEDGGGAHHSSCVLPDKDPFEKLLVSWAVAGPVLLQVLVQTLPQHKRVVSAVELSDLRTQLHANTHRSENGLCFRVKSFICSFTQLNRLGLFYLLSPYVSKIPLYTFMIFSVTVEK